MKSSTEDIAIWQIILHTPLWVWPLLLGLIGLGIVQSQDRSVPGPSC